MEYGSILVKDKLHEHLVANATWYKLFQGAFWGLMAGFVAGIVRLVLIFVYRPPEHCGLEDTRPAILKDVHYMYFAMLLFWLTFIVTVIVSLLTKPPEEHYVSLLRKLFNK